MKDTKSSTKNSVTQAFNKMKTDKIPFHKALNEILGKIKIPTTKKK